MYGAFCIVHYVDQPMHNMYINNDFYVVNTLTRLDAENEPRHLVQQNMQIWIIIIDTILDVL